MDKFLKILKSKRLWTYIFWVFMLICLYIGAKMLTNTYITIQFDELAPFNSNMPLYYKGFKVGNTRSIKPSKDFKHTLIKAVISYKGLKLPKNTNAMVKKIKKNDGDFNYIELEYPNSPSIYYLKTGSLIKGKASLDWNTLISQQADKGKLDDISDGISSLLTSLKDTSDALKTIFNTINDILVENRPNLYDASSNLSGATANLEEVSFRMNTALPQERLDRTTSGFEGSSANVDEATKNLKEVTVNLNQMMPYIDATIIDVNSTMCNVNQITAGILETLKKRLGLMKILIGRPINDCCP